jgi:hypothetical protein
MDGSFTLGAGEAIYIMQKDRNLVLYRLKEDGNHDSVVWESRTEDKECNEVHALFQADFNLVVYGPEGMLWQSGTARDGLGIGGLDWKFHYRYMITQLLIFGII